MMNDRLKADQDKATWQRRIDEALSRLKNDARKAIEESISNVRSEGAEI